MTETKRPLPAWLAYVAPMFVYLVLTSLEASLGGTSAGIGYPAAYAMKIALVAVVMWFCRSTWRDLRPWPSVGLIALAVGAGLLVTALWVGLDPYYPRFGWMGQRTPFDPDALAPLARLAFLAVRFFGLVLVVPLFEELFWRSFLMRWVVDPEFKRVPIGKVTALGAGVTSGLFALAHPEWLPALLTGLIWAGLLAATRSVSACVVSHVVANLALGIFVLATGRWEFL